MDSTMKTVRDVLIGMTAYLAIAMIPVLIFSNDRVRGAGGLILGGVAAIAMLFSMKLTILHAIHMQKGHAAYLGLTSAARMFTAALLLVVVGWSGWVSLITTFVGLFSLKFATYMQPLTEKLMSKAIQKKQGG